LHASLLSKTTQYHFVFGLYVSKATENALK